ncbi:serine hydrolase domain-containing protein [Pedobacter namyangjuensis]|uniref:serine hydrolase domain-containing protein n=1 Tax=Pedobacter namyangjuensis TaxID=600626 RepID=UPI000DE34C05|nr:serine hydrolase domain-containing protein [Pedobacter namyangjuensis]
MFKKQLLTILFYSFLGTVLAQQDKAENEIKNIMKDLDAVGLAVAVVKDGKLTYTKSFGLQDRESKKALETDAIFRIASISKSFSATAIMQLVQDKKFSLEDDFSDLVGFKVRNPKFPNTKITLKMVLSHRSSINDKEGYFNLDAINPDKNKNWANCYNDYEPGKGYQYCNLNFNMVGAVIEKFSGKRFDNYIKTNILSPLNLYGGYCVDSLDAARFATLYEYDANTKSFTPAVGAYNPRREELKNYTLGYTTPIFSPTGGMKISATDLAKYMIMHMNYGSANGTRIISRKSAKIMQTKLSEEEGYGLAITTVKKLIEGKTLKGHTGSAYGLYSSMFFDPKEKFGFVVITNGCNPIYVDGMNSLTSKTINILYKHFISN